MKIAQVTATFPPNFTGIGNVCYHNALELGKLGHEVTVFTPDYRDYDYPKIIKVKKLNSLFKYGNAPFLPGLLKIKGFEVIHIHCPFFFGLELTYLAAKLREQNYIVTYQMDVLLKGPLQLFVNIYNKLILKPILKNAKYVIVSSMDYAKSSVIKDLDNLVEIPNGVNIKKFNLKNDGSKIRKKHSIKKNDGVILFVGGLDKAHFFKGIDLLLKSFSQMNKEGVKLVIVGEGNLKNKYMNLTKELNMNNYVIFAGTVSDEELPYYYAASDLVVLPSITRGEAFGLVLVEAIATGKPIITSDLPGIRVTAKDGGLLIKPGDIDDLKEKLELLLKDKELRKQLGLKGRKNVEKQYDWRVIGLKLDRLLKDKGLNL